jgi:hypothetical protein
MMLVRDDSKTTDVTQSRLQSSCPRPSAASAPVDQSEVLPAGDWAIVVQRPQEAAIFGHDTAASVDVTVF